MKFSKILLSIFSIIAMFIMYIITLLCLWECFISPIFGLPTINLYEGMGLFLIWVLFNLHKSSLKSEDIIQFVQTRFKKTMISLFFILSACFAIFLQN